MSIPLYTSRIFQVALSFLAVVFLFGIVSPAHAADATVSVQVSSVEIGQPITVTYSVATTSFRTNDRIIMVNEVTGRTISTQYVGSTKSGVKTFSTKIPGTYVFKYQANILKSPIFGTSDSVLVRAPSASAYTLTVNATTLSIGQSLVVTYAGPQLAHQSSDSIVILDAQNRQVASQSLGVSPSGSKTFTLRNPGTYTAQYKLSLAGRPVVKTAGPVTVRSADASEYTLTLSATTLTIGQSLVVTYAGPRLSHQSGDSIVIVDSQNRQITSQSLGVSPSGSKTFILRNPGTYTVQYRLALTGRPVIKSAGPVTVGIPNASLFTVSANINTAEIGQPITVSFSAPTPGYQSADSIVLFEQPTGKIIKTVPVGTRATGVKIFEITKPGTYGFAYRLSLAGNQLIAKSETVRAVYVNTSRIENYPLGTGPIIALGDSITFGRDATAGNDFVSLLSSRIGETIINAGVNGDTTAEALARLDIDVLSKNPRLVIVFLGGNDFLQKVNTNTTFNNIGTIVDQIEANGSAVLVLAYKNYFLVDYDARFRELAWARGAAYAPNVMGGVLGNPFYTTDLIHPRNNGHKILADRVEPYVRALTE